MTTGFAPERTHSGTHQSTPPTVLIPAYHPGPELLQTLRGLRESRPAWNLTVVDDGSGPEYARVFTSARELGAQVVTHTHNQGKGKALKHGFEYVMRNYPGSDVISADADGQHAVKDIVEVGEHLSRDPDARKLVLGTRELKGSVPLRSRFGNTATRWLFTVATRQRVADTQTGLRGIPAHLLGWSISIPGERYEYELQMLLRARASGITLEPHPIQTIYLDHNSASHFRPVADSIRIYLPLLTFLASAMAAFVIDTGMLLVLNAVTGNLLLSVIGARLTSAGVNFSINRWLIFDRNGSCHTRTAVRRYVALTALILGLN